MKLCGIGKNLKKHSMHYRFCCSRYYFYIIVFFSSFYIVLYIEQKEKKKKIRKPKNKSRTQRSSFFDLMNESVVLSFIFYIY